jgi:uncharacterized protein YcfL
MKYAWNSYLQYILILVIWAILAAGCKCLTKININQLRTLDLEPSQHAKGVTLLNDEVHKEWRGHHLQRKFPFAR